MRLYLQNEGILLGGDNGESNNDINNTTESHESIRQRKQIALKKAEIDFDQKRIQQRKMALCRYFDYDRILQDRIQKHVDTLKQSKVKYESMLRKQHNTRLCQQHHSHRRNDGTAESFNSVFLRRFDDRNLHLNEIVRIINDQVGFVQKLNAKSVVFTRHGNTKMKENQEKWKSVQYALDFVNSKQELSSSSSSSSSSTTTTTTTQQTKRTEILSWVEEERNKLVQSLVECDVYQETLLDKECSRFEKELEMLASSSNTYHSLSECVLNIETWEAERFGIQTTLMSGTKTITNVDEAEMYFQMIDDNQMKLNSARKHQIPKLYQEASDLYHTLHASLEKYVCFDCDENGNTTATLKASMTLPSTNNYCWSVLEWMDHFTKMLHSFEDKDSNLRKDEQSVEDHYKDTLRFAHNRREMLLSKLATRRKERQEQIEGDEKEEEENLLDTSSTTLDPKTLTRLKWGLFGTSTKSRKIHTRATGFVRDIKNMDFIHSKSNGNQRLPSALTNVLKKSKSEDEELEQMKIVVKKRMNSHHNDNCVVGVTSLMFTVGKEETSNFLIQNDNNEASGLPFYQSRIDLGSHVETVLWVQIDSSTKNCITSISWTSDSKDDNRKHHRSSEIASHEKLSCALCIERDSSNPKVISSIQITYANSKEHEILGSDYEIIPKRLSEFDLVDAYLWVAHVDRSIKRTSTIDLREMNRELVQYEEMLSQNPTDYLLQSLVKEMERRITLTKRREKEQRGLVRDHLEYIKDFLALSEQELNSFKKLFLQMCRDLDGVITTNEFIAFLDESQSLTTILSGCMKVTLGNHTETSNTMNFGEFTKAIGILAMFSQAELMKCLFCAMDNEGFGFIPKQEFYTLLSLLHPEKDIGMASRSIRDVPIPESISFDFFKNLTTRFPTLFFPISRLQQRIRKTCLGTKWWNKKMRKFLQAKELVMKEKGTK